MTLKRIGNQLRLLCALVCLTAWIVAAAPEYQGQVTFGGMPLPGATVTVTQGEKKFVAIVDQQGVFSFPDLAEGTWTIQIQMTGFTTVTGQVAIGRNLPAAPPWEMKMLPLDQMKAEEKPVIKGESTLPVNETPNAPSEETKAPGNKPASKSKAPADKTASSNDKTPPPADKAATPDDKSNAAADKTPTPDDALSQAASDGFLINGSQNNGASSPFAQMAAFGNNRRGPGGLYNGGIGFTLNNSALDARPFSLSGFNTPKVSFNNFTGVATFGGPLKIPHIFKRGPNLFVAYQWTRNRNASVQSALVPDLNERAGDFSNEIDPTTGKPIQVFNPATGTMYPNDTVPISPQAKALLNLYPLPNLAGSQQYNFQTPITSNTHIDAMQMRLDKSIDRKNQVSGGFSFQSSRTSNPNLFGFTDSGNTLGINTNANWIHHFGQRVFLSLVYRYSRQSNMLTPFWANRENISGDAGITGNNQDPVNWGPPGLNFSSGIQPLSDGISANNRNQTSAVSASVSWNRIRHNFTFGGDFRRQEFNYLTQQDPRGTFTFSTIGAATATGCTVPPCGSDVADFLIGIPSGSSIAFGNADKYLRQSVYDAYANDDWRVSPQFTVNVGIRWEYGAPITELFGRLVNLDIGPGFMTEAPVIANNPVGAVTGQIYPNSLVRPDKHGIEPRIGIAWRPISGSSLVVRAKYGVYFDTSVFQSIALDMAQQAPLSTSLRVKRSPACPLTLAMGFNPCSTTTADSYAIDPNFRVGYAQIWQLDIQRELPGSFQMTLTYQGTKGTRGPQAFLPNTFAPGAANPCPTCPAGYEFFTSNGNSTREAGILQLRRRLHNGLTGTLLYTYSKSIDDDSALGGQGALTSGAIAQNWLNLGGERGLSTFDQRHLLTGTLQYTTGMGMRGGTLMSGWKGRAYKEWTVLTNVSVGSGLPQTPIITSFATNTGFAGTLRPDLTGAPIYTASPGFFLNQNAYAAPPSGQFGNAGRDSITGPAQFSLNASMARTFRLHDRLNLDFQLASTNILNHVVYSSWYTNLASPVQFGAPAAANSMRNVTTTLRLRF